MPRNGGPGALSSCCGAATLIPHNKLTYVGLVLRRQEFINIETRPPSTPDTPNEDHFVPDESPPLRHVPMLPIRGRSRAFDAPRASTPGALNSWCGMRVAAPQHDDSAPGPPLRGTCVCPVGDPHHGHSLPCPSLCLTDPLASQVLLRLIRRWGMPSALRGATVQGNHRHNKKLIRDVVVGAVRCSRSPLRCSAEGSVTRALVRRSNGPLV